MHKTADTTTPVTYLCREKNCLYLQTEPAETIADVLIERTNRHFFTGGCLAKTSYGLILLRRMVLSRVCEHCIEMMTFTYRCTN